MAKVVTFLFSVLLLVITPAAAQFMDGHKLVAKLREFERAERSDPNTSYIDDGIYLGYVQAIFNSHENQLCPTGNATVRQVTSIVAKYLNDNPSEWGKSANTLVLTALRRAFPCK
jgi:Rap1a immunity proteins